MRQIFRYEVASRAHGRWQVTAVAERRSSREPESVARGLLEQWIIDNHGRLPGGSRVYVCNEDPCPESDAVEMTVRVRVFRGDSRAYDPVPVAVAYLGDAACSRQAA